jgi:sugar lactone lactonase YvrE
MTKLKPRTAAWLLATFAVAGCGTEEVETGAQGMPTQVDLVTDEGFQSPLDVVSSPDGSTFYFTAFTTDEIAEPAIFSVPSAGGAATPLHVGAPLASPTGLVMSCDGGTLYVADMAVRGGEDEELSGGRIYSLATGGGTLTELEANGIARPTGLALAVDCQTLYVTGWTDTGMPALFRTPVAGGDAEVVFEGEPLLTPTGLHIDGNNVSWVMDQRGSQNGTGVLFAITDAGDISVVLEGMALGAVGGVSLNSIGTTAFMPVRDEDGVSKLTSISLVDQSRADLTMPGVQRPAGLRTARQAPVFALVDNQGNAIYRAE